MGAGIADFSLKGPGGYFFPLMRRSAPDEPNASHLGSFFMAPWVNRIRAGRFGFEWREQVVKTNTADGMAQHGDVRKRAWKVVEQSATFAALEFDSRAFEDVNWPWSFVCRASYALAESPASLRIDLSLRNTDRTPFPAGCGHHPYFMRRLWNDSDDLHLRVPVRGRYPLESGCAIGPATADALTHHLRQSAPLPAEPIDAVFTADPAQPNIAELHWPASSVKLRINASANMGHWVVYAPHEDPNRISPLAFIAVEPQTQVNDAMNLASRGVEGTGTVVLVPGEMLETTCVFELGAA